MKRKSKSDYPPDWPEIAQRVKEEAGWKCVRCGHVHDVESGHVLTVHHLDMDPQNCAWWNLAALCQKCHLTIQAKVNMEQPWIFTHSEWFRPYVAGYYAHTHGLSEDRVYVMDHLDELIALR
jgi:transcription elongation factor Elf1